MKITIYELLGLIRDKKIKDKTKFRITWWGISESCYRDFYYDADEENELDCLKNVSDDYPLQDAIKLNDEVEIIEEDKKIEKLEFAHATYYCEEAKEFYEVLDANLRDVKDKINEIIDKLNEGDK